jgi:glycosyltransferase domain-containing protein
MEHVNVNSKLTVLLTLKDRVEFTYRWMEYAQFVKLPFKVLIADGGISDDIRNKFSSGELYPDVNYHYLRYPHDNTYLDYYSKVLDALSKVKTQYVVMADNDDFFMAEGLQQSVNYLESHVNYVSCRGLIGSLNISTNGIKNNDPLLSGNKVSFKKYKNISNTAVSASCRVKDHFSSFNLTNHYLATWYDVHRTDDLLSFFKVLVDLNIKDLYLAELLLSYLTVATGKVRRECYNYLIRQENSGGSSATTHHNKWGDSFDRLFLDTWSSDFSNFTNAVAEIIVNNDEIQINQAKIIMVEGYKDYIAPHVINCILKPNILLKIMYKVKGFINILEMVFKQSDHELNLIKKFIFNRYNKKTKNAGYVK